MIFIILAKNQWQGSLERILAAIPNDSHLEILKIIRVILIPTNHKPSSESTEDSVHRHKK